ncbi:ABC transporter substrate-binding protein [Paenarthrobacter sp. NPDC089714]|uniref:ABC transporter substrate-binding protein n=1 Tax=Paenarthrobacter sp. NPDC089714 TaxID=3364377 RepID=UPI00381134BC
MASAGCGSNGGNQDNAGPDHKITLVSSITGSSFLGVTAGLEQKIFQKHGLDLEVIKVKSSAEAAAAVASGQADLAAMLPEGVVAVTSAGSKMTMVGNLLNQVQYRLETSPAITSAKDLIGKKIGLVGPGSGEEILVRAYLDSHGVAPSQVTFVATGTMAAKYAAVTTEQVDGTMLVPPFDIKAEAAGLNPLSVLGDDFPDMPAQVYASNERKLSTKTDSIKKFLAASTESTQWILDHPEDATKILSEDSKVSLDDARASYERAKAAYSPDGSINEDGLNRWLELSKKFSSLSNIPSASELYSPDYLPAPATASK